MFEDRVQQIKMLDIGQTAPGTISRSWLHIINNGLGEAVRIPILVARGRRDGPVLGLTAALHGNELNGIPLIQQLFAELSESLPELRGTVVGVLAMNIPGLLREQRVFNDGVDLNHIAPGRADGTVSQVYVYRLVERIVRHFDYLIDLHTASFGRVNAYYIRADMGSPVSARMARLQGPEIIVHNPPNDKTLRGVATSLGIPSITAELRDPQRFQADVIEAGLIGMRNVLHDLDMLQGAISCPVEETILCSGSHWLYTDEGGLLAVLPRPGDLLTEGQPIAEVRTIFGEVTKTYHAPSDGVVIGRSVNPINQTGSRILHIGHEPKPIPCLVPFYKES